jgi:hypothetical protein
LVEDVWRGFVLRFRPNPFTTNDGGDRNDQIQTNPDRVSLPIALIQGESTSAVATEAEYRALEDVAEVTSLKGMHIADYLSAGGSKTVSITWITPLLV